MYCINSKRIRFSEKTTDQERYNLLDKIYSYDYFMTFKMPNCYHKFLGVQHNTYMPMVINYTEE